MLLELVSNQLFLNGQPISNPPSRSNLAHDSRSKKPISMHAYDSRRHRPSSSQICLGVSEYVYTLCRNAVVIDNNGVMHAADMQNRENFILGAQHTDNKLYFEFAPLVSPKLALLA